MNQTQPTQQPNFLSPEAFAKLREGIGKEVVVTRSKTSSQWNWGECEGSQLGGDSHTIVLKEVVNGRNREHSALVADDGTRFQFYSFMDWGMGDASETIEQVCLTDGEVLFPL